MDIKDCLEKGFGFSQDMGCGEIKDLDIASTELYIEVKSRTSNGKRRIESAAPRFSKSKWSAPRKNESACRISAITDAKKEKNRRLMWLLEVKKGDRYSETRDKGSRPPDEGVTIEDSNFSVEGTALKMLRSLNKRRSKTSLGHHHGFDIGELVWGKIESHPWWPGQIYDESIATLSVCLSKQEGCELVAFFGDNTYGWLDPKHIIPFECHFEEKSKQSQDLLFLKAVDEALIEVKKRSALGLDCKCRKSPTFKTTEVRGRLDRSTYSVDQIKNAVNGFNAHEVLCFLQELALTPEFDVEKDVGSMKNVGRLLAYRNAVCEVSDEILNNDSGVEDMDDLYGADVLFARKKAHQARFPLDNSKSRVPFKKELKLKSPKGEIQNTNSKEKASRKRSLQESIAREKASSTNKGRKYSFDDDNEKTMLVIKFPPQEKMPSVSELKAKFARFGPFYESAIRILWKSSTCQVVFVCRSKAQAAYDHAEQNRSLFGELQASYFLQALEGSVSDEKLSKGGKSK